MQLSLPRWNCAAVLVLPLLLTSSLQGQENPKGPTTSPRKDASAQDLPEGARMRLGDSLWRPRGVFTGFAFTADSKTVAVCEGGPEVVLYDLKTARKLDKIPGIPPTAFLAIAPDGESLVLRTEYDRLTQRDISSGKVVREYVRKDEIIVHPLFSPDGVLMATTSGASQQWNRVTVWDFRTGKMLHSFLADQTKVNAHAFSPDSKLLATVGDEGIVQLWEMDTGKKRSAFPTTKSGSLSSTHLCFHPEGKELSLFSSIEIHRWDLTTNKKIEEGKRRREPLVVSLDGSRVVYWSFLEIQPSRWPGRQGNSLLR